MNAPKPFLKWVGGKGKLVPQLVALMPKEYKKFHEPFVGGGALLFGVQPHKMSINDINATLMGAYKNIKKRPNDLIDCLKRTQASFYLMEPDQQKNYYYEARKEFNSIKASDSLRKTCLLIFINKTCYNGMYRENAKGEFNVPFGKYKKPLICDSDTILADSEALKSAEISSVSFEKAALKASKGDFVYFDPPYYPLTKTANFTNYSEFGFEENDQVKLKRIFDELNKKGCYVMLSNSNTPFVRDLYKGYRQEKVLANRAINCKAEGRGKIEELVIINY